MSMKKVEQFFKLIEGNEVLAKRLAKINEELKSESEEFLNCEQAINEKIIPFAEENGISFTAKDFLDYTNSKLSPQLTREDLLNVSGGVSPKTFAITLGALLTLPFASGSLMSFADDGIGSSVPQQTQTQAATQNAADNGAETPQENEQETFDYEQIYFSNHRSYNSVKNNLVNFINKNNIKSPNQIGNLVAFIDDAGRVAPMIVSKDGTVSFNGEPQDIKQGPALDFIKNVFSDISLRGQTPEKELDWLYGRTKSISSLMNFNNVDQQDLRERIKQVLKDIKETRENSQKIRYLRGLLEKYTNEKLNYLHELTENVSSLMEIPDVNQDNLAKDIEYILENVKETSKNSKKEMQHLQELLEEHGRYNLEKERLDIALGHRKDPLLNYMQKSIKDPNEKMSSEEKLDDLFEVAKFIQSIKDLPEGFNLRSLIVEIENVLNEVKETRVNSYKVQHLRNLCNEYEKNYSAKDFVSSKIGDSFERKINNVYDFISSPYGVTKETENSLKSAEIDILKQVINQETWEIDEALYFGEIDVNYFGKVGEIKSKLEKIKEHFFSNYATQQYKSLNNFEKLSPIEQLRNLSPVVSKCESIFDVHGDTVKDLRKNIEIFIGETWNERDKVLEMNGTLNTKNLQELEAVGNFANKSGIPFIPRLNKIPNNPKAAEIFDRLLKTSRRINTTNDLPNEDAKAFEKYAKDLALEYYNPRQETFEVPGAEGINGKQIIDVCKNSGIKLKIRDNYQVPQKNDITGRFNKLARILGKARSVDDLSDLEGTKKELQDLANQFYNARKGLFEIPVTEVREGKLVEAGSIVPENGKEIIDGCKMLGIELKIDFRKLPEELADNRKFLYVEEIAKRINSTDDLTETGKKVFESEGTKLIEFLQTIKNSVDSEKYKQYIQLYNRSKLKGVYENSKNWSIIYFSPGKEMNQMSKINYFAKVLKMHLVDGRKFEDPNNSEENYFEGKKRTDRKSDFISDVLKLGGTHYNAKKGKFEITDGSHNKVTDEENDNIEMVKKVYEILINGDSNSGIEKTELNDYISSWTLARIAQGLVNQLKTQDWNWAAFSPETLQDLISDLRDVVSRIERGRNELYYLNDAWFGTNENRSIESKDLEKLKEVLADYNSWL